MADEKDDYEVGYGKPPKQTQFTKGKSGNPRGRPKGSQGVNALFMECINEKVRVTEGVRETRQSFGQVMIKRMVREAAGGNPGARREVLQYLRTMPEPEDPVKDRPENRDHEKRIIAGLLERQLRMSEDARIPSSNMTTLDEEEISNIIP